MKKFLPLALVALLALTGCTMPEEPESHSEQGKTTEEAPVSNATTKDAPKSPKWVGHMNEIKVGMMQTEVKSILGKPDDTDSTETSIPDMDPDTYEVTEKTVVMDSWTYGDMFSSADGDDLWMLSFTDGKLDSKTRI